MSSDQVALASIIIAGGAALCAVLSVIFSARQTRLLAKSITELSKQTKMSSILSSNAHFQDLDRLILTDQDLLALIKYKKPDIFAAILINGYSVQHKLLEAHVITEEEWGDNLPALRDTVRQDFFEGAWENIKHLYTKEFRTVVYDEMRNPNAEMIV